MHIYIETEKDKVKHWQHHDQHANKQIKNPTKIVRYILLGQYLYMYGQVKE